MKIDLGQGAYLEPDEGPRNTAFHKRIVRLERLPGTRVGYQTELECGHKPMMFGDVENAAGIVLCSQCKDEAEGRAEAAPECAEHSLTDQELLGLAGQALGLARADITQGKGFNFLLASYHDGEGLHRMTKIEALVVEKLGEDWLNDGAKKDFGFHIIRIATDLLPPDAVIFVTMSNMFVPTEKMMALPHEEQKRIAGQGHDAHHRAAHEGYFEIRDALVAVAQTPERVCIYHQFTEGAYHPVEAPAANFFQQSQFGGRLKMFGEEADD